MNERGVSLDSIQDALNNPLKVTGIKYDGSGRPSMTYIGEKATVVINPDTGENNFRWKIWKHLIGHSFIHRKSRWWCCRLVIFGIFAKNSYLCGPSDCGGIATFMLNH